MDKKKEQDEVDCDEGDRFNGHWTEDNETPFQVGRPLSSSLQNES